MQTDTETQQTTETQARILTAHDRCDRCSGQAWVRTYIADDGMLQWCAHHYREVEDGISDLVVGLVDEREHIS